MELKFYIFMCAVDIALKVLELEGFRVSVVIWSLGFPWEKVPWRRPLLPKLSCGLAPCPTLACPHPLNQHDDPPLPACKDFLLQLLQILSKSRREMKGGSSFTMVLESFDDK